MSPSTFMSVCNKDAGKTQSVPTLRKSSARERGDHCNLPPANPISGREKGPRRGGKAVSRGSGVS